MGFTLLAFDSFNVNCLHTCICTYTPIYTGNPTETYIQVHLHTYQDTYNTNTFTKITLVHALLHMSTDIHVHTNPASTGFNKMVWSISVAATKVLMPTDVLILMDP